jgi:hypothetical protein
MSEHEAERRRAACRSFWSDHPLNMAFRVERGERFTLREFVSFVVALPADRFHQLGGATR